MQRPSHFHTELEVLSLTASDKNSLFLFLRSVNFGSGLNFQMQSSTQWDKEWAPSHADPPFISQIEMQEMFLHTGATKHLPAFLIKPEEQETTAPSLLLNLLTHIICKGGKK